MDRLLACPACAAHFTFADWLRTACCPHCGVRVNFAAAAATATPAGAAEAPNVDGVGGATWASSGGATAASSGVPVAAPPQEPVSASGRSGERLVAFGKPLALTKAWIVVFAIWVAAGGLLAVARVEMGHLPVLTPREQAAIGAVEKARMADGTSYAEALALVRKALDPLAGLAGQGPLNGFAAREAAARWYVIDRPWEHTVYVAWEQEDSLTGQVLRLVWTVQGRSVKPEAASYAYLLEVVKAAHNQGASSTSPAVLPDPDALATAEPTPVAP